MTCSRRPLPWSRIARAAWRLTDQVPRRLIAMTSSNSSGVMLSSVRSRTMPALLTTASMPPNCSTAVAISRSAIASSATEPGHATAEPPAAVMSETTSSTRSPFVPFTTTRAPSAASASAKALPSPRVEPVTTIRRPFSCPIHATLRGEQNRRSDLTGRTMHPSGATAAREPRHLVRRQIVRQQRGAGHITLISSGIAHR